MSAIRERPVKRYSEVFGLREEGQGFVVEVDFQLTFGFLVVEISCLPGLSRIEIDQYGFSGADIDISAIRGPIADISQIFRSTFLLHYQKYNVFYALTFFQKRQKSGFISQNFSVAAI